MQHMIDGCQANIAAVFQNSLTTIRSALCGDAIRNGRDWRDIKLIVSHTNQMTRRRKTARNDENQDSS